MLIAILAIIGIIDWQQRRIPNKLVVLLLAVSCAELLLAAGTLNPAALLLNILIASLLTVPAYFKGIVGGGDVKLMFALVLSWSPFVFISIYALGVAITVIALELEKRLARHTNSPVAIKEPTVNGDDSKSDKRGLPLGSAMAFGAVIYTTISYVYPITQ